MKIVVSHLTRMRAPFICVAGINPETGRHVRPVLESGQLGRSLLARHGGPFDIAAMVELGPTRYAGHAPEMEDHRFDKRKARCTGHVTPAEFWQLLRRTARPSVADIFGDDLRRHGDTYAVDFGQGTASLGSLLPTAQPRLIVTSHDRGDRVRLHLTDGAGTAWLSVTDARLYDYQEDYTPNRERVQSLARRIDQGVGVILSVGLGRPWHKPGDTAARHWLQVNNIHLEDDPTWQERSL